jgi:hypothetical protein
LSFTSMFRGNTVVTSSWGQLIGANQVQWLSSYKWYFQRNYTGSITFTID